MRFSYQAKDESGAAKTGTVEGETVADVARKLSLRGLEPLEIKPLEAEESFDTSPLAKVHWGRLIAALLGFGLLLTGLGRLPRLFGSAQVVEITIDGTLQTSVNASFSRTDTKVYVSFPSLNRTLRPDAQEFEVEGGRLIKGRINKWLPISDPHAQYDITWFEANSDHSGHFQVKLNMTLPETPKSCRLTVRKRGFIRARGDEFALTEDAPGKLSGTAPDISLLVGETTSGLHHRAPGKTPTMEEAP